ncbi:MAG TPA: hypothetical protein VK190_10185 [Pseudoneobacillus sp.]|nr:hypothetical protein [Pseudoneobacillus sp.]
MKDVTLEATVVCAVALHKANQYLQLTFCKTVEERLIMCHKHFCRVLPYRDAFSENERLQEGFALLERYMKQTTIFSNHLSNEEAEAIVTATQQMEDELFAILTKTEEGHENEK